MTSSWIVAVGLVGIAAEPPAQTIAGAFHCRHSGTGTCGPDACVGAGIIERHPVSLDIDTRAGSITLGGLRGSFSRRDADRYGVVWDFDLAKPTELSLQIVQPVGVMATLRSPDRINDFICKPR